MPHTGFKGLCGKKRLSNAIQDKTSLKMGKITSKGHYTGKHELLLERIDKISPKHKLCFLFPGQGSELSGRFHNEFSKYNEFGEIFDMADAFSKKHSIPKISDFLLNHSALSYNQSQRIKNLCLIATELAFFNVLKS